MSRALALAAVAAVCCGCAEAPVKGNFPIASRPKPRMEFDRAALAAFEGEGREPYRLGPGDVLQLDFWTRPELSGRRVVGPDGSVSVPLVGAQPAEGLTADELGARFVELLRPYYKDPSLTVRVDQFTGIRIHVLGRVKVPGAMVFDEPPTLLEVVSRAGPLPEVAREATLSRCAVIRGRDKMLWVDLQSILMQGDLALNVRLRRGDLVYIPDSDETVVYVLGQVARPGAYRLTPGMSVLDALAQAGGETRDAARGRLHLVRPSTGESRDIDLEAVTEGKRDSGGALALAEGDVLYAPPRALARFGYVLEKISPAFNMMLLGVAASR